MMNGLYRIGCRVIRPIYRLSFCCRDYNACAQRHCAEIAADIEFCYCLGGKRVAGYKTGEAKWRWRNRIDRTSFLSGSQKGNQI